MYILLNLKSVIKNIIHMHFYLILHPSSWNLFLLINNLHRNFQYICLADQGKKCNSGKKFSANNIFSCSRFLVFKNAADCCTSALQMFAIYPEYLQRILAGENVVSDFIIEIVIMSLNCYISTIGLVGKNAILVVLYSQSQYCNLSQKTTTFDFCGVKQLKFGI